MDKILGKLYFVVVALGAVTLSVYGGVNLWHGNQGFAIGYAAMLVLASPIMVLWGYAVMTKKPETGKKAE